MSCMVVFPLERRGKATTAAGVMNACREPVLDVCIGDSRERVSGSTELCYQFEAALWGNGTSRLGFDVLLWRGARPRWFKAC